MDSFGCCISVAAVVAAPLQFFDLHDMFLRWANLPQCKDKQLDYSQFLQALGRFQDIPEQEKVRLSVWGLGSDSVTGTGGYCLSAFELRGSSCAGTAV